MLNKSSMTINRMGLWQCVTCKRDTHFLGGREEEEGYELKLNNCSYNLWQVETNKAVATDECD